MPDFHPFKGRVSKHFHDNSLSPEADAIAPSQHLAPDDAYLSYYDIRLTKEDVDCIRNDWLTDNAIAFWEEYLEREKLRDYQASNGYNQIPTYYRGSGNVNLVLLRPAMSFLLMNTADPLTLRSALPNFENVSHIFLPINDNRNVELAEGGSHWSLLVVSKIDSVAFHYDSMNSANEEDARLACRKLSILLYGNAQHADDSDANNNKNDKKDHINAEATTTTNNMNGSNSTRVSSSLSSSSFSQLKFINLDNSPQQENGSDCGVFVCMQMQYILLEKLLRTDCRDGVDMSLAGISFNAVNGRKMLLKAIETFRRQGEKNRSVSPSPRRHTKSPPRVGDET